MWLDSVLRVNHEEFGEGFEVGQSIVRGLVPICEGCMVGVRKIANAVTKSRSVGSANIVPLRAEDVVDAVDQGAVFTVCCTIDTESVGVSMRTAGVTCLAISANDTGRGLSSRDALS